MLSPSRLHFGNDAHSELDAFNTAFQELGLPWHWDDSTYERLLAEPCERRRVHEYVAHTHPHLLRAYDADFLADVVLSAKQRCLPLPEDPASSAASCLLSDEEPGRAAGF